jgi:hypothetical protein
MVSTTRGLRIGATGMDILWPGDGEPVGWGGELNGPVKVSRGRAVECSVLDPKSSEEFGEEPKLKSVCVRGVGFIEGIRTGVRLS